MASEVGSDDGNMVRCPIERRERPSVELLARLAPTRSLVDTLIAERGVAPHDALAGFAREFAYQARALEAGHDRDEAIVWLRIPVDVHLAHAIEICRAYQEAADRIVRQEVAAAQADHVPAQTRRELEAARAEVRGRAIAARVTADAALGAATALATYTREGLGALPVSEAEPRQLLLFATTTG